MSLLERLMQKCEVYARREEEAITPYDPTCITKLVKNYR